MLQSRSEKDPIRTQKMILILMLKSVVVYALVA